MKRQFLALFLSMAGMYSAHAQNNFQVKQSGTQQDAKKTYENKNNGNVGIGIQVPTSNLHLSSFGNAGHDELASYLGTANAVGQIDNLSSVLYSSSDGHSAAVASSSYLANSFIVNRVNSTATLPDDPTVTTYTDMVVDQYGNTGIGLAAPTTRLHVYGLSSGGVDLFQVANDKLTAMYVTELGLVGIGTANPFHQLDVRGDANVQSRLNVGLHGNNSGSIYLTSPGLGAGSYAFHALVSDPYVKAISIEQQCQTSGCSGTTEQFVVMASGQTIIGGKQPTTSTYSNCMLAVNGNIAARKVMVEISDWNDKVFEKTYSLPTLEQVETYIKSEKHLPDVPSECEVIQNGISVGDMNATLLKKIEELTLYVIQQQKEIDALKIKK